MFLGSGARLIGDISIADDVAIGAGAVVVKSIDESDTTWGGSCSKAQRQRLPLESERGAVR